MIVFFTLLYQRFVIDLVEKHLALNGFIFKYILRNDSLDPKEHIGTRENVLNVVQGVSRSPRRKPLTQPTNARCRLDFWYFPRS